MDILKLSSFHFSWTLNSRFECPGRRYIFHEFNPYILYQESWLSNNILNHVVCFIGKCSMCWHILLLLLLIQAMMDFFCSCNCELAASRSFCTLLHTTHCCDDLLPTNGGVCPEMTTRDPYFYHPMAGGSSSPSKGITLYLTMESDKFTALYPSKG